LTASTETQAIHARVDAEAQITGLCPPSIHGVHIDNLGIAGRRRAVKSSVILSFRGRAYIRTQSSKARAIGSTTDVDGYTMRLQSTNQLHVVSLPSLPPVLNVEDLQPQLND